MYVLLYMGTSGTRYYWHRYKGWVDNIYLAHRYSSYKLARRAKLRDAPYKTRFYVPFGSVIIHEVD